MLSERCGPLEQVWRECGLPVVTLARLHQPRLILRRDRLPCAFVPAEAHGPAREILFGWLIVELARGYGHWPPFVTRLDTRRIGGGDE